MTKQELYALRHLNYRIQGHLKKIMELREQLDMLPSATSEPVIMSPSNKGFPILEEIDKLERTIAEWITEMTRECERLKSHIDKIEREEYKTVLTLRYIDCLKWEEISKQMGYDSKYVFKIHRRALRSL